MIEKVIFHIWVQVLIWNPLALYGCERWPGRKRRRRIKKPRMLAEDKDIWNWKDRRERYFGAIRSVEIKDADINRSLFSVRKEQRTPQSGGIGAICCSRLSWESVKSTMRKEVNKHIYNRTLLVEEVFAERWRLESGRGFYYGFSIVLNPPNTSSWVGHAVGGWCSVDLVPLFKSFRSAGKFLAHCQARGRWWNWCEKSAEKWINSLTSGGCWYSANDELEWLQWII